MNDFRRRMLQTSGSAGVYDSKVDYVVVNANQAIKLPVAIDRATDAFEITFRPNDVNTTQQRVVRSKNSEDAYVSLSEVYIQGAGTWGMFTTSWATMYGSARAGVYKQTIKIDYKAKRAYLNKFTGNATGNNTTSNPDGWLELFAHYSPKMSGRIYSFKYWKNNEILMDCIPVRKDGVGYLYDTIGGELYGDETDGGLGYGGDIGSIDLYTTVDYIESDGNAFIDTEFVPNQNTKVWFDMFVDNTMSLGSFTRPSFFGVRSANLSNSFLAFVPLNITDYFQIRTTQFSNVSFAKYGRIVGELSKDGLILNNESYGTPISSTFTCPGGLTIFGVAENGGNVYGIANNKLKGKCFGFKIWDDDNLVRDYVPVVNNIGIYGLYDDVEEKFYSSNSSTEFTGGNL